MSESGADYFVSVKRKGWSRVGVVLFLSFMLILFPPLLCLFPFVGLRSQSELELEDSLENDGTKQRMCACLLLLHFFLILQSSSCIIQVRCLDGDAVITVQAVHKNMTTVLDFPVQPLKNPANKALI